MAASKTLSDIRNDFGVFRSAVALKKAQLPYKQEEIWSYYQLGGEDDPDADPVIFLPGTTTGAECFFYQLDALSCKGYRCISCQYPPYYTVDEWVEGFERFLDVIKADKVYLFGVSLGGFLAQAYAVQHPRRVGGLLLCNSFTSTASFAESAAGFVGLVHVTPTPLLRNMLLDNFPSSGDPRVLHANEWVKERLAGAETLDGYDLASRITLAYNLATIGHVTVEANNILIIDVNDQCVTTAHVRQELKSRYPDAKVATLKQGGDFPFLSCASELTLYIEVHLRNCGLFPLREQVLEEQRHFGGDPGQEYVPAPVQPPAAPAPVPEVPAQQTRAKVRYHNPFD
mmetsp:Transcript_9639/g.23695  ORF Transcript_9639/g.23695 Transcript_9639/m.23695 type:complete len:342 (-) Transcript_9639:361-1386(-)|eukprot:g7696.t1